MVPGGRVPPCAQEARKAIRAAMTRGPASGDSVVRAATDSSELLLETLHACRSWGELFEVSEKLLLLLLLFVLVGGAWFALAALLLFVWHGEAFYALLGSYSAVFCWCWRMYVCVNLAAVFNGRRVFILQMVGVVAAAAAAAAVVQHTINTPSR